VKIIPLGAAEYNNTGNAYPGAHKPNGLREMVLTERCSKIYLQHSTIVNPYHRCTASGDADLQRGDPVCYGVMVLACKNKDCKSVREWLTTSVTNNDIQRVMAGVQEELARLHKDGVVHNQVTPDNVWVNTETLEIHLLDFSQSMSRDIQLDDQERKRFLDSLLHNSDWMTFMATWRQLLPASMSV
jgi:serine/threonine protein kinase